MRRASPSSASIAPTSVIVYCVCATARARLEQRMRAALGQRAQRALPFAATPVRPIPLHALQRLYISAGVARYALLDALS
ncbi:hypothetical protein WS86_08500 [Burkholderia savannae]|nr:hypothetical protein WS86_08500 [Burkholderia savannae]KWZ45925.1 hypothetical protein WS73_17640 [Burkholderia savannae]